MTPSRRRSCRMAWLAAFFLPCVSIGVSKVPLGPHDAKVDEGSEKQQSRITNRITNKIRNRTRPNYYDR